MKTRIISAAVILPVAFAILLVFPPYALTVTISLISAFAANELFSAVNRTCKKPPSPHAAVYAVIAAAMVPFVVYLNYLLNIGLFAGELTVLFILICLLLIDFFLTYKAEKRLRLRQLLVMPAAALMIPYMLSSLIWLRLTQADTAAIPAWNTNLGRALVVLPVIITVLTDSGAYFTGKAIGRHKPLPDLSPNKTVEGFIGGILAGIAGMLLYGLFLNTVTALDASYPVLLIYGIAGAVMTEFGDLAFSFVKRKCGIKDYGKIIPGHGGMLDRFDSLIFTAPAMLALCALLPAVS